MDKQDIIAMAREAGFEHIAEADYWHPLFERFAALVAASATEEANRRANASWSLMCEKMVAAEREACAQVCEDEWSTLDEMRYGANLARYIRASGETK